MGTDNPMSEDQMNKVNVTKKRIPVLSDLRTQALKERHWKQVQLTSSIERKTLEAGTFELFLD